MKRAVFLDRDGVIIELVLNPATGEYGPPRTPEDVVLCPDAIDSLRALQDTGFELFLVSNQPDYAKGKTTLENLQAVHERLDGLLRSDSVRFREYYYCYHHPDGVVPVYTSVCECRKPKPYFLRSAAEKYDIDLSCSWMIGDRDTDIGCGRTAGTRTILIEYPHSSGYRGSSQPDYKTANLKEAVQIILRNQV
jgi:D-glycero-D-manno-heptose 1,7-bisphosphate phosphatase